jgi:hypothetical protein
VCYRLFGFISEFNGLKFKRFLCPRVNSSIYVPYRKLFRMAGEVFGKVFMLHGGRSS